MCKSFDLNFIIRILQGSSDTANSNDGGPEFAEVFVIVWIGSMVVTLNSKLLGGNMWVNLLWTVCCSISHIDRQNIQGSEFTDLSSKVSAS